MYEQRPQCFLRLVRYPPARPKCFKGRIVQLTGIVFSHAEGGSWLIRHVKENMTLLMDLLIVSDFIVDQDTFIADQGPNNRRPSYFIGSELAYINESISLLSGQYPNKFNWLSSMTYAEPLAV
jgi:hypothetical protein